MANRKAEAPRAGLTYDDATLANIVAIQRDNALNEAARAHATIVKLEGEVAKLTEELEKLRKRRSRPDGVR
jgi:hypothetical protein